MTTTVHSTPDSTRSDSTSLTVAIVDELAAARGCDPTELPPLSAYVDLEALSALFRETRAGTSVRRGTVTFRTEAHEVRVHHDRTVEVEPVEH